MAASRVSSGARTSASRGSSGARSGSTSHGSSGARSGSTSHGSSGARSGPASRGGAADGASNPWLVVGLGNPGDKYAASRHNAGYLVIDELLADLLPAPGSLAQHRKTNSLICQTRFGETPVVLARPRTYMNESGSPVANLAKFFKVPAHQVIVIYDELDLDPERVRVRMGGGDHGHNGLRSITKAMGTKDYARIAVGIGRPPGRMDVASYVLKPFSKAENAWLPIAVADAADAARACVQQGVEAGMRYAESRG
ncbi:Peptidyl-tRNA hydrolase [Corynebacterium auriscanis]|nr:Peptidyl-tRNA hydrolase [Corynebacterium auriscanis]